MNTLLETLQNAISISGIIWSVGFLLGGGNGGLLGTGLTALGLRAEKANVGLVLLAHFGAVGVGVLLGLTELGEVLVETLLVLVVGEGGLGASEVDFALVLGALGGSHEHAGLLDH